MKPEDLKVGQVVTVPMKYGYRAARVKRVTPVPSVEVDFDDPLAYSQVFPIEDVGTCDPVEEAKFWKECFFKLRDRQR